MRVDHTVTHLCFYLHDAEELDSVVLAVIEDLVAEHGAHWVVADIIGNSNTTPGNIKKYLKILENLKRA